ncbi:hypothetical protein [Deinococcus soli (ex Cha et al. 2016)]|uniref:Uncharacterized protein n=2 Tax=Deinococcus soli (ex Cha et al. 2016) TaxID=1309411 RepID=A0AAE3XCS7_9DEIO|nr:hypothetical protein [Deinococcus soli (ex Cha et al. 2016)]MDR6218513.1 hypothetical protein [Deinococcus soli (ex Cha et al. 2016)]MDR6329253.1 hypothetical protein [Deinococcus soli (ex Cha et al. 2016)]MDR6751526.1 hypothetical protein [Deinococcus soli (ex Cha et al. 2016)]
MKRLLDPTVREQLEQKHSDTFGPIPDPEKNWDGFNTYATQLSEHGFPTDAQLLLGSIRTPDLENPIEAQAKKAVSREKRAEQLKSAWTNRDSSGRFPDKKKLLILGAVPGVILIGWLLYATTPKQKPPASSVAPTTEENVASFESDAVEGDGTTPSELLVPEGEVTGGVPAVPTGSVPTGAIPSSPSVTGDNAAQPSSGPSIELDPGVSQPPTSPPQYLPPAAMPSSPVVSQPPEVSTPTPLSPPSAPSDYTPVPVPNLGTLPEPSASSQVTLTSPGGASMPATPAARATVYTRPAAAPAAPASATSTSRVYQRDATRASAPATPVKPVYQRPASAAPATSTIYTAQPSGKSAAPGTPAQSGAGSVVYQRKGTDQPGADGAPKNIVMYRAGAPTSASSPATSTPAATGRTGQPGPATITTEGAAATVASASQAAPTASGAPANVLYSRKASAAAQAAQVAAQPAAPSYTTGQQLPAVLTTRVVAAMGASVPVIAQTQDGAVWIGVAQIDLAKRMQITFDRVVIGGREVQVQAMAFTTDGAPGLNASVSDQAPTFATEALRAGVSGVNSYVQNLLNSGTTTISPNGTTVVTKTPPSLTDSILSNITGLFSLPKETQTFIAVGEVPKGTSLLVVVGVGSKGGGLR